MKKRTVCLLAILLTADKSCLPSLPKFVKMTTDRVKLKFPAKTKLQHFHHPNERDQSAATAHCMFVGMYSAIRVEKY